MTEGTVEMGDLSGRLPNYMKKGALFVPKGQY